MEEHLDEELLEQLYWDFDAERNKGYESERDIFKKRMRFFAKHTAKYATGGYIEEKQYLDVLHPPFYCLPKDQVNK